VIEVRRIRQEDLEDIYLLGLEMRNEGLFRTVDYDQGRVYKFLRQYIDAPDVNYGVVARENGKLIGFFTGYISLFFFGRDTIATEVLWYVAPKHRGSRLGVDLLKGFEDWAKDQGAAEVCIGISTGVHADKTGQLLERRGYHCAGGIFKRPVVG